MESRNVLFAGLGGHGMLLSGKLLAQAAMTLNLEVSWLPAYGAEMRGGTANATVCMSVNRVASPYIEHPQALVVMNESSLIRFGDKVKPGGTVVINDTLTPCEYKRSDIHVVRLPAGDMAIDKGNIKSTNLVLLGAYVAVSHSVPKEVMVQTIEEQFALKSSFLCLNVSCFLAGYEQGMTAIGHREVPPATRATGSVMTHSDSTKDAGADS